jgi:hypothetical protein
MEPTATLTHISEATGVHRTSVARKLDKNETPFIWNNGKSGKVKLYFVNQLPRDLRIDIAKHNAMPSCDTVLHDKAATFGIEAAKEMLVDAAEEKERRQIAKEDGLAMFELLSEDKKALAYARRDLLSACSSFVMAAGYKVRRGSTHSKKGFFAFIEKYNSGHLNLDDEIRKVVGKSISYSTLNRWRKNYDKHGLIGLKSNNYNPRKGNTKLTEEQQKKVLDIMIKNPATSCENIRKALLGRFRKNVPSTDVIRRFCANWTSENQEFWLFLTNPDEWRNKRMFAFGSASEKVTALNGLWEADSTPADLMLTDGRHSLIGMNDVYSRRMKFFVSRTSRATAVVSLIRRCILDWGVPEILKTDNGKDYISNHVVRVLDALDIEQVLCTPFKGEEKPHMERGFRTFLHGLVELMPGYIGHNVAERKAIEARRTFAERVMNKGSDPVQVNMSSEELQTFCDNWTEHVYHHDRHGGLNGEKPIEIVRSWTKPIRRISNTRALDMLLMPAPTSGGERTIGKKGVQVENRYYQSPDFAGHVGDKVFVLLDPTDLGTIYIYLINESGEKSFLCPAIDPIYTGIDRKEFYTKSKNHQAKLMRERKRQLLKETKSEGEREAYKEYIDYRKEQVDNIINFPEKSNEHTSAGLEEAYRALDIIDNQYISEDPLELTVEEELAAEKILLETAPGAKKISVNVVDARGDFYSKQLKDSEQSGWDALDGWERFEYLQNLPAMTETQRRWVEYYKTTSEYETLRDIYEEDAQTRSA